MSVPYHTGERYNAEEPLHRSEEYYRLLVEGVKDYAIFMLDPKGRVTTWNEGAQRIKGYGAQEIIGEHFSTFYTEEDVQLGHPEHELRVAASEGRYEEEGVRVSKDGSKFWASVLITALRDEEGNLCGFSKVVRDITKRRRVEQALRQSEERYQAVVEQAGEGIFLFDAENKHILETNAAFREMLGYAPEEIAGMKLYDLIQDSPKSIDDNVKHTLEQEHSTVGERSYLRKDGSTVDVEVSGSVISFGDKEVVCAIARDITERKRIEQALRQSEERFRALVQNASDVITILERDATITYESPAIERILGYEKEELLGENAFDYVHPDDFERVISTFTEALESEQPTATVEFRFRHKDGSWRWFEGIGNDLRDEPSVKGIVINSRDITRRKELEDRLTHQAFHDSLTGLPNRALFLDRLKLALARLSRHDTSVGVLFMDLDDFKVVNDSLGHECGDRLLVAVGQRLQDTMRAEDTVARLGGDEFTVLLENISSASGAIRAAERVIDALRAPFVLDGNELFVTASVGIALGTSEKDEPQKLLRDADVAMYQAKRSGKASYAVFEANMGAGARARLDLYGDLRGAVKRGEFTVFYQPKVAFVGVEEMQVAGMEALLRWQHPRRGLISPAEFVPLAEETGLIVPIGRWVLEQACHQARQWQQRFIGEPALTVCVNLSAREFKQPALEKVVAEILQNTGLNPAGLVLEVTESSMMEDTESAIGVLHRLKDLGVQLAIDDFGTGYSSLSYLKRLPIDILKIDKSFVDGVAQEAEDAAIIKAVLTLAQTMGLRVVAEGVESADQLKRLRQLGCEMAQGYHFARPLPGESACELLQRHS